MTEQQSGHTDALKSVKTHSPRAIAKHHGVELETILQQLKMGIAIEKEHTTDSQAAREIALDHLLELPDYYTRLVKMEESDIQDILHRSGVQEAKKDTRKLDQFENLITDIALRLINDDDDMDPATAGMDILDAVNDRIMTESVRRMAGTWYDPMKRALEILENELPEEVFAAISSRINGGDEYLRNRSEDDMDDCGVEDEWEETSVGDIANELSRMRDGLQLGGSDAAKFDELIQQLHNMEESIGRPIEFRLREWTEEEYEIRKRSGLTEECACQMMDSYGDSLRGHGMDMSTFPQAEVPMNDVFQQVIPELRGIAANFVDDRNAKQRLREIAKELSVLQKSANRQRD